MRGVHLKRKLRCTEKAGVLASWLLHHGQYVRQYYSECCNRDVQMHIIISKIESQKLLFTNPRKFQPSKYSSYTVIFYTGAPHILVVLAIIVVKDTSVARYNVPSV